MIYLTYADTPCTYELIAMTHHDMTLLTLGGIESRMK